MSVGALFVWGLNLGIDFKGGAIVEVSYLEGRPEISAVKENLDKLSLGSYSLQPAGSDSFILRSRVINDAERPLIQESFSLKGAEKVEVKRFNSIGPVLGKEAAIKSIISILIVIFCIVIFIAFAFRKVSEPVSSWKYGFIAIIALLHDVLVPTGVFAVLGYYYGYEIDTLFVTALLVVLGFSIHDTIVVFDRVRENLNLSRGYREKKSFDKIVGESVSQTFTRSINTSLTTVLALVALYIFGAESTKHFSLALIIGITAGTYSSIFLGSPLLVTFEKWQNRKK
ncbi:MAG: Protein translocase subunit SecF [Parcubacteria group bacterium GW2011_GWA1_40_21]|nr:MAG: Protein translocase subunit SecF [Parcubacteria group bacterium GW2011_GWC1_40_13]KKR54142.1 MAG: Protein translocase subunit SecF [Parcubacteria group bacterium GW2011_GWA1_40_21]